MSLHRRPMRSGDVLQGASLLRTHPCFEPQYRKTGDALQTAWIKCLGREAFQAIVLEEKCGANSRMLGVGVFVFVRQVFLERAKQPPFFWLGPELAKEIVSGDDPLLSDEDVRRSNATGSLNLVAWPMSMPPEDMGRPDVANFMVSSVVEGIRGYRIQEIVAQTPVPEEAHATMLTGLSLLHRRGVQDKVGLEELRTIVRSPHVLFLTKEAAMTRVGAWSSTMFLTPEPRIGFSRCEQLLMTEALHAGTDEELAARRCVSVSAVKKAWKSIYRRVVDAQVELGLDSDHHLETGDRGKQKKQLVLGYVREHPEELRPVDMRYVTSEAERQQKAAD